MIEITIPNWDKYNPRGDVKTSSWFRFEHIVMFHPEWRDFRGEQWAVLLFVMSFVSLKKGGVVETTYEAISEASGASVEAVIQALDFLEKKKTINIKRHAHVTRKVRKRTADVVLRTDGRDVTDETNGTDGVPKPSVPSPVTQVRDAFLEAYRREFKREYIGWGKKANSQAKTWLESVPLDKALELCWLYPKWNDPFVTKIAHPFGMLIKQYNQMEAWAKSAPHLIQKIAAGRAMERVDMKSAEEAEELRRGVLQHERKRQALGVGRPVQGQLQNPPQKRIPEGDDGPSEAEFFGFSNTGDP